MAKRDLTRALPYQLMDMDPELEAMIETALVHEPWALRWFEVNNQSEFTVVLDAGDDTLIIESPGFRTASKDGHSNYITPAIYETAQGIWALVSEWAETNQ